MAARNFDDYAAIATLIFWMKALILNDEMGKRRWIGEKPPLE